MTTTVKEEVISIVEKLGATLPGYRRRPAQWSMIARIATLFGRARAPIDGVDHPHVLCVDAPTGTGKSQGYLIPAIVMAKRTKKKLVVASATVGLQEQLCEKDLPILARCIDGGITYSIAKGRTRYVCTHKLNHEAGAAGQMSLIDEERDQNESQARQRDRLIIKLHQDFNSGKWSGDRDALEGGTIDDETWGLVTTDRHGCLGNECPNVSSCPFLKAREAARSADVIVANHDLLLADLSLGGGVLLTDPEETLYCIDEAHHLPAKTIQAFAARHTVRGTIAWAEKLSSMFSRALPVQISKDDRDIVIRHAEALISSLNDLRLSLDSIQALKSGDEILRFPFGMVPEEFYTYGGNISVSANLAFGALNKVKEELEEARKNGTAPSSTIDKAITDIGYFTGRLENVYKVWNLMLAEAPEGTPPIAKWVEAMTHSHPVDYVLCASPISASSSLKNAFFDKAHAVVLASATLTTLGKFDLFLSKSGLSFMPERVETLQLPSPFDFARQGKLIIPQMFSDPKNAAAHTAEVLRLMPQIVNLGAAEGVLVLFASRRQMQDVADGLLPGLRRHVLIQGELSKEELIRTHKERVDSGAPSILFGLAGLSEGVDLPGKYCTCVVIAKLPFAVPTDPVEATEAEWLESVGRKPFIEVAVPSAGMKLAQSVGRLIRTETDTGTVYVLDTRLGNTNYGKMLLKGLPPFEYINNLKLAA